MDKAPSEKIYTYSSNKLVENKYLSLRFILLHKIPIQPKKEAKIENVTNLLPFNLTLKWGWEKKCLSGGEYFKDILNLQKIFFTML